MTIGTIGIVGETHRFPSRSYLEWNIMNARTNAVWHAILDDEHVREKMYGSRCTVSPWDDGTRVCVYEGFPITADIAADDEHVTVRQTFRRGIMTFEAFPRVGARFVEARGEIQVVPIPIPHSSGCKVLMTVELLCKLPPVVKKAVVPFFEKKVTTEMERLRDATITAFSRR